MQKFTIDNAIESLNHDVSVFLLLLLLLLLVDVSKIVVAIPSLRCQGFI